MNITHTISILELTRLVVSFIGIIYTLKLILSAITDLKFLRVNGINHLREYSAKTSILIFCGILSSLAVHFVVAIFLMTQIAVKKTTIISYTAGGLYILSPILLTTLAFIINYRRNHMMSMLTELETADSVIDDSYINWDDRKNDSRISDNV